MTSSTNHLPSPKSMPISSNHERKIAGKQEKRLTPDISAHDENSDKGNVSTEMGKMLKGARTKGHKKNDLLELFNGVITNFYNAKQQPQRPNIQQKKPPKEAVIESSDRTQAETITRRNRFPDRKKSSVLMKPKLKSTIANTTEANKTRILQRSCSKNSINALQILNTNNNNTHSSKTAKNSTVRRPIKALVTPLNSEKKTTNSRYNKFTISKNKETNSTDINVQTRIVKNLKDDVTINKNKTEKVQNTKVLTVIKPPTAVYKNIKVIEYSSDSTDTDHRAAKERDSSLVQRLTTFWNQKLKTITDPDLVIDPTAVSSTSSVMKDANSKVCTSSLKPSPVDAVTETVEKKIVDLLAIKNSGVGKSFRETMEHFLMDRVAPIINEKNKNYKDDSNDGDNDSGLTESTSEEYLSQDESEVGTPERDLESNRGASGSQLSLISENGRSDFEYYNNDLEHVPTTITTTVDQGKNTTSPTDHHKDRATIDDIQKPEEYEPGNACEITTTENYLQYKDNASNSQLSLISENGRSDFEFYNDEIQLTQNTITEDQEKTSTNCYEDIDSIDTKKSEECKVQIVCEIDLKNNGDDFTRQLSVISEKTRSDFEFNDEIEVIKNNTTKNQEKPSTIPMDYDKDITGKNLSEYKSQNVCDIYTPKSDLQNNQDGLTNQISLINENEHCNFEDNFVVIASRNTINLDKKISMSATDSYMDIIDENKSQHETQKDCKIYTPQSDFQSNKDITRIELSLINEKEHSNFEFYDEKIKLVPVKYTINEDNNSMNSTNIYKAIVSKTLKNVNEVIVNLRSLMDITETILNKPKSVKPNMYNFPVRESLMFTVRLNNILNRNTNNALQFYKAVKRFNENILEPTRGAIVFLDKKTKYCSKTKRLLYTCYLPYMFTVIIFESVKTPLDIRLFPTRVDYLKFKNSLQCVKMVESPRTSYIPDHNHYVTFYLADSPQINSTKTVQFRFRLPLRRRYTMLMNKNYKIQCAEETQKANCFTKDDLEETANILVKDPFGSLLLCSRQFASTNLFKTVNGFDYNGKQMVIEICKNVGRLQLKCLDAQEFLLNCMERTIRKHKISARIEALNNLVSITPSESSTRIEASNNLVSNTPSESYQVVDVKRGGTLKVHDTSLGFNYKLNDENSKHVYERVSIAWHIHKELSWKTFINNCLKYFITLSCFIVNLITKAEISSGPYTTYNHDLDNLLIAYPDLKKDLTSVIDIDSLNKNERQLIATCLLSLTRNNHIIRKTILNSSKDTIKFNEKMSCITKSIIKKCQSKKLFLNSRPYRKFLKIIVTTMVLLLILRVF